MRTGAGCHIETGIWAAVPATTDQKVVPTVVGAYIPHGTVVLFQGHGGDGEQEAPKSR